MKRPAAVASLPERAFRFQILRYRRDRYVAVAPGEGWLRSWVSGRGFRLERRRDRPGFWEYTLQATPG